VYVIDKGAIVAKGSPKELIYSVCNNTELLISVHEITDRAKEQIYEIAKYHRAKIKIERNSTNITIDISAKKNLTTECVNVLNSNKLPILELKLIQPNLEDALFQLASGG
jgi:ABC-type multidrug transport system ATPase subunit